VRKFEDPNGGDVNYMAFIQAIDEEYTEQVMEMEMESVQYFICLPAGQVFNLMMYGDQYIPVNLCHVHPSKIILSNSRGPSHMTWTQLSMGPNVNQTYNATINKFFFAFIM